MSFEKGSFALTVFRLPRKMPENAVVEFRSKAAAKLDDVKGEPSIGWVGGRHLLELNIDEETAMFGGHLYLNLRIAQRKVPASLLNAECRREELVYLKQNKMHYVPGKIRRTIKKEIEERRLMQMPPAIEGVPFVIDKSSGMLYLGTASPKKADAFLSFFYETLKIEPVQLDINDMMARFFKEDASGLDPVAFAENAREENSIPGRDFLTWLWFHSEERGGKIKAPQLGDFEIMIDGPLTFALSDEAQGAGETVVRKGSPLRSAEAKAALSVGKKLKKAKFTLVRDKEVWTGVFNADIFNFSGLALPKYEGGKSDAAADFADRINALHIFQSVMQEAFKLFAGSLRDEKAAKEKAAILKWSSDRESC